jgi:hypothetical protein
MQRGIGASVFCSQCNNQRTGARLVPMYSRFANAMTNEMDSQSRVIDGQVHLPAVIEMRFEDCHLGAVARQALAITRWATSAAGRSGENVVIQRGDRRNLVPAEGEHEKACGVARPARRVLEVCP